MFVYTLVGDYGYETLKLITAQRKQYFAFTQIIIAYWILVSAVLLLNIFIALMSGEFQPKKMYLVVCLKLKTKNLIVSLTMQLSLVINYYGSGVLLQL